LELAPANAWFSQVDQTTVDWALAVDYGTIVTCAAVSTGDRVEILEVGFDRCLPSPVGVDDDGR
jgi:molecular chaperone DnaK (HSP70)